VFDIEDWPKDDTNLQMASATLLGGEERHVSVIGFAPPADTSGSGWVHLVISRMIDADLNDVSILAVLTHECVAFDKLAENLRKEDPRRQIAKIRGKREAERCSSTPVIDKSDHYQTDPLPADRAVT